MATEGAGAVVVLAMHVVCDGSAERNESGSWSNRQKPPLRQSQLDHVVEGDTCLAAEDPKAWIEGDEAIEMTRTEANAAIVETVIAVAAAKTIRQQRTRRLGQAQRVTPIDFPHRLLHARIPSPRLEVN